MKSPIPHSKRLRVTLGILLVNFITFWVAMYYDRDLTAVGVGLMTLNAPMYAYLFGETSRPSIEQPKNKVDEIH